MKYFLTLIFCIAVLTVTREKIKESRKREKLLSEILFLIRHLKNEIVFYLKPIGKALENFTTDTPELSEFIFAVRSGKDIKSAYLRLSESSDLTDETKKVLERTFSALGTSYLEENLKILGSAEEPCAAGRT